MTAEHCFYGQTQLFMICVFFKKQEEVCNLKRMFKNQQYLHFCRSLSGSGVKTTKSHLS